VNRNKSSRKILNLCPETKLFENSALR